MPLFYSTNQSKPPILKGWTPLLQNNLFNSHQWNGSFQFQMKRERETEREKREREKSLRKFLAMGGLARNIYYIFNYFKFCLKYVCISSSCLFLPCQWFPNWVHLFPLLFLYLDNRLFCEGSHMEMELNFYQFVQLIWAGFLQIPPLITFINKLISKLLLY